MCMISVDFGQILIKIWDATAGELKHLRRPKPRIEELKKATERLETRAKDIYHNISLAQLEEKIPTNQVRLWLTEMHELKAKAAKTEQDFERRRCLGGWSWNCFSVNRRVAERMDEIDELMKQAGATSVAAKPTPPAVVEIPTSNSTTGMESYMSEIMGYINNTNIRIIGIYGMGGVGKTTLLKSVNNHRDVAKFDQVIWAVASKDCRMERLQMDIAKRLNLHLKKDDSEEERATRLFHFLKNKDCLLLLDDLWKPLDLEKLGMVHASSGQGEQKRKVVVFTTRDEQVCGGMKARCKMKIKCLKSEQAWELFQRNAGEDAIGSDVGINRIARQIAKKCAGLPLALVTVGVAMSTKRSCEAWQNALTLMEQSQMPKLIGKKKTNPMFSAFKLSYDSLEDDDMRNRLLSCALWPASHLIEKDKLIECWMGLGLIDDVDAIHQAYNRGHSYIETLKAACLLELGVDNYEWSAVKMHDVIRDMALWMTFDCRIKRFKWVVKAGGAMSQALEEEVCHVERVSLMYNHHIAPLPNKLSTCSNISVLMLQHNIKLKEIPGSLFQAMCALTYLDLEASAIREIPKEIEMLSQLRYLNLSWTPIERLPAEMGFLINLKYLLLRGTFDLTEVAEEAISNLSLLKLLDLRESGYNGWWNVLKNLKGGQKSIGIDISFITTTDNTSSSISTSTIPDRQCICLLERVSIWRLNVINLSDSTNLNQILWSDNTRQTMEELRIEDTEMGKLLINMKNEEAGGLECLKYLELFRLHLLKEIEWAGVKPQIVFPNLRELSIDRCRKLRNVNWALQLPSLSFLSISYCEDMEKLITDEGNSSSFDLRRMRLNRLPKLRSIVPKALDFPYLEEINVQHCPRLIKLPFKEQISKNSILKVIHCDQTWWENLKWEESSIKDSLSPLVRRNFVSLLKLSGSKKSVAAEEIPPPRGEGEEGISGGRSWIRYPAIAREP